MGVYPNSGVLFKNDKKKNEKNRDYQGNAEIDGVAYWVSAWIKTGKSGVKFMSLSFKPKERRQERAQDVPDYNDDALF